MNSDSEKMNSLAECLENAGNSSVSELVLMHQSSRKACIASTAGSTAESPAASYALCSSRNTTERLVGFSANGVTLVFLSSDIGEAVEPAVAYLQSAIALCQIEPVLQIVESWLGKTSKWCPCELPTSPPDFWIECVDAAAGVPRTGVVVDTEVNSELPGLPGECRQLFEVQPGQGTATVDVDYFSIDSDDESRLAPGALLVLPASFSQPWFVTMRTQGGHQASHRTGHLAGYQAEFPVMLETGHCGAEGRIVIQTKTVTACVSVSAGVPEYAGTGVSPQSVGTDRFEVRVQLSETLSVPYLSTVAIRVGAIDDRIEVPVSLDGASVLIIVGTETNKGECSADSCNRGPASSWSATLVRLGSGMGALLDKVSGLPEVR